MKMTVAAKLPTIGALTLALVVFSGCIRRTSDPVVEETDFWPVNQKISVSNPIGKVTVSGDTARIFNPHVRVEKRVQTYSLLGLANPDKYQSAIEIHQGVKDGELQIAVNLQRLPFLERLFVKVSPRVDFVLDAPVALPADLDVNVGAIEISNMVGNMNAAVNVGDMKIASTLGIFGTQNVEVNIGALDMRLPAEMPIRYDLETNIGKIESAGFDARIERRLLGARTTGVSGMTITESYVKGRVNIGNITFLGE
ncbi:MAG TPA: hypothetical protein ENN29_01890 [Candidatus Hydrogenedentes bacterium]|nr:hypothetical protein [Candidatus Hydrogenedentota bacterium]